MNTDVISNQTLQGPCPPRDRLLFPTRLIYRRPGSPENVSQMSLIAMMVVDINSSKGPFCP